MVSVTVIPTAAARLFRDRQETDPHHQQNGSAPRHSRNVLVRMLEGGGRWLVDSTVRINTWTQQRLWRSAMVIALLTGASIGISYVFWPKVEYLPEGNRNFVFVSISPPPGYNMDQLMEMGTKIEQDLEPYWNVDPGSPEAEALPYPVINYYFYVVRGRQVFMGLRTEDESRVRELIPLMKQVGSQFPGTLAIAAQSSLFERGLSGGRAIDIEITGSDLDHLVKLGGQVLAKVHQILPEAQAIPRPSLDLSSPEIHIEPKLMESAEMGVNASDLGYVVNALVDGAYAGDYFVGGDRIDLTIVGSDAFVRQTQDIASLPVATGDGQLVPLSALADIRLSSGPEQINRRERQRTITIQVKPPVTMPLETAMERIQQEIVGPLYEQGDLEGGYIVNLSGTADRLREAWQALRWNLALALAITYLLMAALFESWLYPFVIILSVPLGAAGGILGLALLNLFVYQSLDVLTMLGFVILIGTVVNNAILIVHQSLNHIRFDNMSPRQAVAESVRSRFRPIFITTMTTVLGLLPLVIFPGAGSELYRGIGSVVLGGLIVSTVFTLFLVPTVFIVTLDIKHKLSNMFGPEPSPRPPLPPEPPAADDRFKAEVEPPVEVAV